MRSEQELQEYRLEVRRRLEGIADRKSVEDDTGLELHDTQVAKMQADPSGVLDWARSLQRQLFSAGLVGAAVPVEYGGQGLGSEHQTVVNAESAAFDLPDFVFGVGQHVVVPTLLAYGTEEQKKRYIPPLLRGDEIWCQLFSEPGAGSDLAGLTTKAIRNGDQWSVTGQKVWTSGAEFSDFGILLARTNRDVPKHQGITMFICDMSVAGVDSRPLVQITGATRFSEVFLDGVEVTSTDVIGAIDDGWTVAMTALRHERGGPRRRRTPADALIRLARQKDVNTDSVVRQQLSRIWTQQHLLDWLRERGRSPRSFELSGVEGSLIKLSTSRLVRHASELGASIAAPGGPAWTDSEDVAARWSNQLLQSRMSSIAGGTDEIQKNLLGERGLGLPREPKPDSRPPSSERSVS